MKPHPVWCQSSARGQPLSGLALPPRARRGQPRHAARIAAPASLRGGDRAQPPARSCTGACQEAQSRQETSSSESSLSLRVEKDSVMLFGTRGLCRAPPRIRIPDLNDAAAACFLLCRTAIGKKDVTHRWTKSGGTGGWSQGNSRECSHRLAGHSACRCWSWLEQLVTCFLFCSQIGWLCAPWAEMLCMWHKRSSSPSLSKGTATRDFAFSARGKLHRGFRE